MKWPLLLFYAVESQSVQNIITAEDKLMCFARYLARDYKASTVIKYCNDVIQAHATWLGVPFKTLGVMFYRLPLMFKWVRKANPSKKRTKRPWERQWFEHLRKGWASQKFQKKYVEASKGTQLRDIANPFLKSMASNYDVALTYTVMVLAFEQLLRASEVLRTPVPSVSEYDSLNFGDLVGVKFNGASVYLVNKFWNDSDRSGEPTFAEFKEVHLRMPPSKCDINPNITLRLAVNADQPDDVKLASAGFVLLALMYTYAANVPAHQALADVPLFRGKNVLPPLRMTVMTTSRFLSQMRILCRLARPEVWYSGLGLHCFRVGGCNRLIEMGATVAQIMALGRWASICWELYARNDSDALFALSQAMSKTKDSVKTGKSVQFTKVHEVSGEAHTWRSGEAAHRWVGSKVQKSFKGKVHLGTVIAWLPETAEDPALWKIQYEDGDIEDFEVLQVLRFAVRQEATDWPDANVDSDDNETGTDSDTEDDDDSETPVDPRRTTTAGRRLRGARSRKSD